MALKRYFNKEEKYGLTDEQIRLGEKYLRKHKTAGAIDEVESMRLYEMFMVGCSFYEIHQQFPQYSIDQIILTAALRKWPKDRDKMLFSLRDRVQAKVVKSVIEQVDFLTSMLSVANAEHLESMRKFIIDPENNPPPSVRVENIKEYKEVVETLQKLVAGASGKSSNSKSSAMFDALLPNQDKKSANASISEPKEADKTYDIADIIAGEIEE